MSVIYAIGSNGSGQLGIGHTEDVSVPKQVITVSDLAATKEVTIRAGGNHTLLLLDGVLSSAGDASTGARGLVAALKDSATEHQFSPVILSRDETEQFDITYCAATWETSIIVAKDEDRKSTRVYSFGSSEKGELGQGPLVVRSPRAGRAHNFPPPGTEVVDLAACMSHVVAVLDNGDVYGWGNGRKGQLGQPAEAIYSPRKITGIEFPVKRAVCGREFTFLVGDKATGEMFLLGVDKYGLRDALAATTPGYDDVQAGWGNVHILHDGLVMSAGRNDHCQCAPGGLPRIVQIAAGSEHVVALTTEGEVVAWGWAEHGNCGPSKDTNVSVPNVIASSKYLPAEMKITSIGAGCATSWVGISR